MSSQPQTADGMIQPTELARLQRRFSPWPLMGLIIVSIFIAEVVAMGVVYFLPPELPYNLATVIDASIMVVLICPILYFFSYRPLVRFIHSLQQAERTLEKNHELQERFFRSMDVMIAYMDRDFHFIKVNEAYARSAEGWTPEDFIGKNHFTLFQHPENQTIFQSVVDTGEPYIAHEKPFEYPDQPERGVTYWNWSLQPVKSPQGAVEGLVLSLVDVTERKRAEQKVELERARLRSILDTMPDGVYIVNDRHQIEYANPVIEREFGPAGARKCYQHFYDRNEPCTECRNESIFSGQVLQREWTSPRTGKVYETFDSPLRNSDGGMSKLKVIHDITVRKQAESELERRNQELQMLSASEHRQRQVAETLRTAAQALTQSLDLDVVLHALLRHLRLLTEADTASV
ncbi:MAG: PAS domain-containing protein, partial [Anaerolineae bacterium]